MDPWIRGSVDTMPTAGSAPQNRPSPNPPNGAATYVATTAETREKSNNPSMHSRPDLEGEATTDGKNPPNGAVTSVDTAAETREKSNNPAVHSRPDPEDEATTDRWMPRQWWEWRLRRVHRRNVRDLRG